MAGAKKDVVRSIHPGSGRRTTAPTPKGRQVDPEAWPRSRRCLATARAAAIC